ncbi:MAG: hypothetical protein ACREQV_04855 [Candidatus Binatia bacterium]
MGWSNEELAKEAGVNPWELRDDLAEGNPAEIIALAQHFHTASSHAADATSIAAKADEITAAGYRVDDTPVHNVNAHLEQTRTQLGNSGENMERIARDLTTIADELATRTTTAKAEVDALDSELEEVRTAESHVATDLYVGRLTDPANGLPRNFNHEFAVLKEAAVDMVRNRGGTVRGLVDSYEEILNNKLKAMADMGYGPPAELDVGSVDASDAAQATLDAIANGNRTEALEAYDNATAYINILNTEARHGPLSLEETKWLNEYYANVAPHFGKIDDWLSGSNVFSKASTLLLHDADYDEIRNRGAVLADGLLNLTQGIEHHENPLASAIRDTTNNIPLIQDIANNIPFVQDDLRLPAPIQDIVESDLRLEHSSTYPAMSQTYPAYDSSLASHTFTVAGLEEASDFSGFMQYFASGDVSPSEEFAKDMAEAGVRWKEQVDDIETDLEEHAQSGGKIGHAAETALSDLSDKFASDALAVAAHNPEAAASLLADDQDARRAVLRSDWEHDQGAANLVAVGTVHNPSDATAASNQAAQKVMQEIAYAPIDFNDTFGDDGKGKLNLRKVLTVMAIDHMDTFALNHKGHQDDNVPTPDGAQAVVELSDPEINRFLTFVGTHDQSYALFRSAALERGSEWIEYGINQPSDSGDLNLSEYDRVAYAAARLDGRSAAIRWTALEAMTEAAARDNEAAYNLAYQEYRDEKAGHALIKGIWNTFKNGFGIASTAGGPISTGVTNIGMSAVDDLWSEPNADELTDERFKELVQEAKKGRIVIDYEKDFELERKAATNWMLWSAVNSINPDDSALNNLTDPLSTRIDPEEFEPLRRKYERDEGMEWSDIQGEARRIGYELNREPIIDYEELSRKTLEWFQGISSQEENERQL